MVVKHLGLYVDDADGGLTLSELMDTQEKAFRCLALDEVPLPFRLSCTYTPAG